MRFPVFDLHCDTALALLGENYDARGSLRHNNLHIDLERASENEGYVQCFACFTSPAYTSKVSPQQLFERQLLNLLEQLEMNKGRISLAYRAKDIQKNLQSKKASAILTIEGPAGFGYDIALLEDLYKVGFRITTLGWNEDNVLAGSHLTGGGLTDLGKAYVEQAQKLGMIVDVSHLSDAAFWDLMDITQRPIIATHSNSRSVCNTSRNLTDEMFLAICRTGGVAGINLYLPFLGQNATLDTVCDHILHFAELDGSVRHIALGGDLDGCDTLANGFAGVQDYPKLAERLLCRGFTQKNIYDIFLNNALGVMQKCCM